ncbi:MAG: DNA-processing protein DprA [candidate division Zixibacteria bacterium]|nr:DNA-processing protein DprA [candidate division Zixibacteria bacterium]
MEKSRKDELFGWVALLSAANVGEVRARNLYRHFGSVETALKASRAELLQVDGVGPETAEGIAKIDYKKAEETVEKILQPGEKFLLLSDTDYPESLAQIFDPPPILFYRGELVPEDKKAVGVVGTRTFSPYGKQVTDRMAFELAGMGVTVVSGMAQGIDSFAHEAALRSGGRTIAVLGGGFDSVTSSRARKLFEKIPTQGAVLTEFANGTPPTPENFPKRNRVISGLSLGVVVVEAPEGSGALITAQQALEQGREVMAVPGRVDSPNSAGTHRLIRKSSAALVTCAQDVISELNLAVAPMAERPVSAPDLKKEERVLFDLLAAGQPILIDELSTKSAMPVSECFSILTGLELKGHVRRLAGQQFVRAF